MKFGMKKVLIVYFMGLDEFMLVGFVDVVEVMLSGMCVYMFELKDVDIKSCTFEDLRGGDSMINVRIL